MGESVRSSPFVWLPFLAAPLFWPNIFMAEAAVDLMALATALFAAALMWDGRGRPFSAPWAWAFLALILIPVSVHLATGDLRSSWYAWRQTLYITAAWLVFAMARARATEMIVSARFCWLITTIAYVYVGYALLQAYDLRFFAAGAATRLFPVWSGASARFPGPLMQANWQGIFLALVVCAQYFQAMRRPERLQLWTALSVVPLMGVLLTSSRSALLAVLLGLGCLLWLARERKRLAVAIGIALALAVALTTAVNATAPAVSAGQEMLDRIEKGHFSDRLLIWDMCLHLGLAHPWIGLGWGNLPAHGVDGTLAALARHPAFAPMAAAMSGGSAWAHNLLLQGWVEGGILGLAAVLLPCAAVLRRAWGLLARPAIDGVALGTVLAGMLLFHGMMSVSVMQPYFMALLALALAAAFPEAKGTQAGSGVGVMLGLVPAAALLGFWLVVVGQGMALKQAEAAPIGSARFIATMGRAIDDPWTHVSALRLFFISLRRQGAPAAVWAGSLPYGWALWHQYQYAGGMEIMMMIARGAGNRIEAERWGRRYAALMSSDARAMRLVRNLDTPKAVRLLGAW